MPTLNHITQLTSAKPNDPRESHEQPPHPPKDVAYLHFPARYRRFFIPIEQSTLYSDKRQDDKPTSPIRCVQFFENR